MIAPTIDDDGQGALVENNPVSAYQLWTVLLIAATVVLDGLDNQMLGLAAPSLIREWGISRQDLGSVFALGFVGMAVGTLASGWVGDRYGRRAALITGAAIFGLATLLTGWSASVVHLALLKTLAGVGLGGVPGTAAAMIAEFTPARWRSVAVTFGMVCISIGGILGGVAAAVILPVLGWRWLFWIGGAVTLVFILLLLWLLPESPRFLARQPGRAAELAAMLRRFGLPAPDPAADAIPAALAAYVPTRALLQGKQGRDTLALSVAMLAGMFMIYLMFNWAPTMLYSAGFSVPTASLGLTSFNIGGTVGAMIASLVIVRLGSRIPLVIMALTGFAVCAYLAILPISGARNELPLLFGLVALGVFASAAQSAMFAVGAHAFPTALRARGLGLMGAAGRLGAIFSALMGAALVGAGNIGFFGILAALMLVNAAGFLAITGHVPPVATAKPAKVRQ